ncbi:acyltransferase family protein [Rothia sp. P5764]|uniref:acyltransferase family protein n=1 Tax=Rothia sp. P5764 TaxID=3402654 RepID=UPI003ACADC84
MNRYAHIDAMRAFAVLLVVFSHAGLKFVPGGSGVTIFFAISGFIITYLLLRERDKTGKFDVSGFYIRRFLKIAPPLILVIVLPTIVYWALGGTLDPLDVLGQIFFFFNLRYLDSHITVLPGSHVMWSLSIEEQFYLVFAILWLFMVRWRNYRKALTLLGLSLILYSALSRWALFDAGASSDRIYFGTDTRLEAIAIGMLTALWYHRYSDDEMVRGRHLAGKHYMPSGGLTRDGYTIPLLGRNWVFFTAIGVYLMTLVIRDTTFRETVRYSLQAWSASTIMLWGLVASRQPLGAAIHRFLAWRPLQLIGLSSYSIYLVHDVLFKAIEGHLQDLPLLAQVALLVPPGLLSGVLIYLMVEVPVQRFKDRRFGASWKQDQKPAPAPADTPVVIPWNKQKS